MMVARIFCVMMQADIPSVNGEVVTTLFYVR